MTSSTARQLRRVFVVVRDATTHHRYTQALLDRPNLSYDWKILTHDDCSSYQWPSLSVTRCLQNNNNNNYYNDDDVIVYAPSVPSTQTLLDHFVQFRNDRVWVVADEQTAGQGRRSNVWVSPLGCLMVSMRCIVRNVRALPFLQYFASLCVLKAIHTVDARVPVRLKWPNDIWGSDGNVMKKVGGVLCHVENRVDEPGAFDARIGMGLNVTNTEPPEAVNINQLLSASQKNHPAAAAAADDDDDEKTKMTIDREAVLSCLMHTFRTQLPVFESHGFAPFLDDYYCHWLHDSQRVQLSDDTHTTVVIRGLSESGFLRAQDTTTGNTVELHPVNDSLNFLDSLAIRRKL